MARDSRAIARAAARLEKMALEDAGLMDFLGLPQDEQEVIRYPSSHVGEAPFSRLDGFLLADRVMFVEFNVDSPGGAAFTDEMSDVFRHMPLVVQFQKRWRLSTAMSRKRILNLLVGAYRTGWGQHRPPHIAIVDWADVGTAKEFSILQGFFERQGYPTRIVDPSHTTLRKGELWAGDFRIDIAYKRVVTRELLDRAADCRDFLRACREGTVCLMNPFRVKVQTVKAVLAALWDDRWHPHLPADLQAAVRRCLPWTARVTDRLVDRVLREQTRLVLKPNDEYGGAGVTLGWTVARAAWEARLSDAVRDGDIVQQRVELPREVFPCIEGHRLTFPEVYVDCDPYFYAGQMGTIGTRFSSEPVLNVKTGGGAAPTFLAVPR
ncbi:MAG TPA: hypothetical protein VGO93_12050 [Candidatus Xenobia bacterium]